MLSAFSSFCWHQKERDCRGILETVPWGWLNGGAQWCATTGPARDCVTRTRAFT
jgi:hypothetical protein